MFNILGKVIVRVAIATWCVGAVIMAKEWIEAVNTLIKKDKKTWA